MNRQTEQDDERLRVEPEAVKEIRPRQAGIRFVAGALASLIAGLVSHFAGPAIAGPLLALPATQGVARIRLGAVQGGGRGF